MVRRQSPKPPYGWSPGEGRTADRLMKIIEILADAGDGLRMSEVARRCSLPKSTVARLLADLMKLGMVSRLGERYMPGARILALAAGVDGAEAADRRSLIMPSLLRLREDTGLATAFSTLRYGQVCFESVLYVSGRVDTISAVALWAPAHCTSSGKVLLAFSHDSASQAIAELALPAFTTRTIINRERLQAELAVVRHNGVAHNDREYLADVSSIAVAVVDARRRLVGALAVCGSHSEISRPAVASALRHAAWMSTVALRRHAEFVSQP